MLTDAQKRAQKKYRQTATAKERNASFTIRTTTDKKAEIIDLLASRGYNVSDFFNYCVELLRMGKIPNRPSEWQSPQERLQEFWRNYRK